MNQEATKERKMIKLKYTVSTNSKCQGHTRAQQEVKLKNLYAVLDLIGQGIRTEPEIHNHLGHLSKSSIHEYVHILLDEEKVIVQDDVRGKWKHYRLVEQTRPDNSGFPVELKLLMGINPFEVLRGTPIPIDYHSQSGLTSNRGFSYGVCQMDAYA